MKRKKAIARVMPREIAGELRAAAPVVFTMIALIFVALRVLSTFR